MFIKKEMKTFLNKKTWAKIFKVPLMIITENWTQIKCLSSSKWINKLCCIHKKETTIFEPLMLSERSLAQRSTYWMISLYI